MHLMCEGSTKKKNMILILILRIPFAENDDRGCLQVRTKTISTIKNLHWEEYHVLRKKRKEKKNEKEKKKKKKNFSGKHVGKLLQKKKKKGVG